MPECEFASLTQNVYVVPSEWHKTFRTLFTKLCLLLLNNTNKLYNSCDIFRACCTINTVEIILRKSNSRVGNLPRFLMFLVEYHSLMMELAFQLVCAQKVL